MAFLPALGEGLEALTSSEGLATLGAGGEGELGEAGDEAMSGIPQDLGNGISMQLLPDEVFRQIMHSPEVVQAITERAVEIKDTANYLAITQGAEYAVSVQNDPGTKRPRANVWTMNYKACIDDAYHSTLLKAVAFYPSDPRPEPVQGIPSQGSSDLGLPGQDEAVAAGDEEAAAGAAAGEAGGLAELSELGVLLL